MWSVEAGFPEDDAVHAREEGYRGQSGFAGSAVGRTEGAGYAPTSMMPNHVKFAARAGDCCVFDLATWHTAQPNTSKLERCNTIQVSVSVCACYDIVCLYAGHWAANHTFLHELTQMHRPKTRRLTERYCTRCSVAQTGSPRIR